MANQRRQTPLSCNDPRFLWITAAYGVAMIGTSLLAKTQPRGSAGRIAFAIALGVMTGVYIVLWMRSLRQLDEMQQRIQLEALAFSFAGTGILATGYGFLVSAGLPNINWAMLTWPVMTAFWVVGVFVARRRYL